MDEDFGWIDLLMLQQPELFGNFYIYFLLEKSGKNGRGNKKLTQWNHKKKRPNDILKKRKR